MTGGKDTKLLPDNEVDSPDDSDYESQDDAEDHLDTSLLQSSHEQQAEIQLTPLPFSNVTESNFLPSLAVGFIPARSESDWSDAEMATVRKNRRGQRARKA